MRKCQREQLLELLTTMRQAQEAKLYADCQAAAKSIAAFIAKHSDRSAETIHLLKQYRQLLFRAQRGELGEKILCKHLAKLKQSVKQNLKPDKIEIVFFPYKASMWDSMESVYLAAKNDPHCDAYCVPIPYFDRKPDGSLGRMHYEGNAYPPEVDVVDWQNYNVEERRPDAIFLHNPYDNYNFVTTVHPQYYTAKLRQYTDLLVYVEYGLPLWIYKTPVPYESVIPGWFHFDLFCTYSKEYARNQIFAMKAAAGKLSTEVVALGSPKFDKVLHSRKEQFVLPREWNAIIAGRKAVLFNTSLGAILKDTEKYLHRLCDVLDIFRNNGEIALWWRPHPLSLSTFQSMRPELAEKYSSIVKSYQYDAWGIYDESADIHRAIAHTDAYYGDESSVVYLYCATGKPFSICGIPHQCYAFTENTETFERALRWRIDNMRRAKGANIDGWNICAWWGNFYEDLDYKKFLKLFLDYVAHTDKYPDARTYRALQLQFFREFVVNWDGTAGQKIYEYCKRKRIG